jgi:hypothetical protein
MAKKSAVEEPVPGVRRCIGSQRFGIEPHEAPVEDFPRQPSQKDGLGRMCKTHWNAYTAGLARDAKARKAGAAEAIVPSTDHSVQVEVPSGGRRRRVASTPQGNRYADKADAAPAADSEVAAG